MVGEGGDDEGGGAFFGVVFGAFYEELFCSCLVVFGRRVGLHSKGYMCLCGELWCMEYGL